MDFNQEQKELRRAFYKEYYAKNRERILERRRKWYAENAERISAEKREWRKAHPEKQAEYSMHSIERKMAKAAALEADETESL